MGGSPTGAVRSAAVPCWGNGRALGAERPAACGPGSAEGATALTTCEIIGKSVWVSTEIGAFILIYIVMKACNSTVS